MINGIVSMKEECMDKIIRCIQSTFVNISEPTIKNRILEEIGNNDEIPRLLRISRSDVVKISNIELAKQLHDKDAALLEKSKLVETHLRDKEAALLEQNKLVDTLRDKEAALKEISNRLELVKNQLHDKDAALLEKSKLVETHLRDKEAAEDSLCDLNLRFDLMKLSNDNTKEQLLESNTALIEKKEQLLESNTALIELTRILESISNSNVDATNDAFFQHHSDVDLIENEQFFKDVIQKFGLHIGLAPEFEKGIEDCARFVFMGKCKKNCPRSATHFQPTLERKKRLLQYKYDCLSRAGCIP
jgi:hypothetical protein